MSLTGLYSLPIARATLRERAPGFLPAAFAILLALSAGSNGAQGGWGGQAFSGFARFFLIGLTMALGAGLISDELDSGHAQLVLLRPLTRAEWYGGRLVGAASAFSAAVVVAWLCAAGGALYRGGKLDLAWLVALPTTIVEGFAWLSVLAALSVFLRRWMNVGVLLLSVLVFFFFAFSVPLALGKPQLMEVMKTAAHYFGPQDSGALLSALRSGQRPDFAPLAYDLFWVFGCWLAGAVLLNGRDLARRRE
jgi:ABC-type transport system involved in multi-copper enzyme maturation permease subunit